MNENRKTCSTCTHWNYNKYIEEKYGMGVGICTLDGRDVFCDRSNCIMHEENETGTER